MNNWGEEKGCNGRGGQRDEKHSLNRAGCRAESRRRRSPDTAAWCEATAQLMLCTKQAEIKSLVCTSLGSATLPQSYLQRATLASPIYR